MFIGAMLDIFPDCFVELEPLLVRAGFADLVALSCGPHDDGTLAGTHFRVAAASDAHGHHHRHYSEIRSILSESDLPEETRTVALNIFRLLAEAESSVHGKSVESVAFHEVGAWDSIADVVCAAFLISKADASWSVSKLPIGGGFVNTAHGRLPVPAPATALLLESFEFYDDGLEGERITPTGAAILRSLAPTRSVPDGSVMRATGFGFGTKVFPGISNVLRALKFESAASTRQWQSDTVTQIAFELDDQTAEETAVAAEYLRDLPGVVDVLQHPVYGKKGRMAVSLQVLCLPTVAESAIEACFAQTTTLGLRITQTTRAVLTREAFVLPAPDGEIRLKSAVRPGGNTIKAEMDDIEQSGGTLQDRRAARASIEALGLANRLSPQQAKQAKQAKQDNSPDHE